MCSLFYLFAVIEKFTENTRFCMICNYLSKIIPALQSRCTRFRFGPLNSEMMIPRLEHVVQQEKLVFKAVFQQISNCFFFWKIISNPSFW